MRRAQTGNPSSFLIHHPHGVTRQYPAQLLHQPPKLDRGFDIAREQNDPGGGEMAEQGRFIGPKGGTRDASDHGFHRRINWHGVCPGTFSVDKKNFATSAMAGRGPAICHGTVLVATARSDGP